MEKERLGDFEIIRKIGRGPLGTVFLGEHTFIKKRFAIKVLPDELSQNKGFIERFQKEVTKIATLEHIGLAKLHNISSDRGVYFIVSDFISDKYGESKNIAQYLSGLDKRLSEKEVVHILKQIAYTLDYIHQKTFDGQPLFHGELKLNNILLGRYEDDLPHLYLTDAGLASIVGQGRILTESYKLVAATMDVDITCTGCEGDIRYRGEDIEKGKLNKLHRSFLQTYAFLAPEQKLGGSLERIGPKSDTYAFGLLAYFLLMGYLPEGSFTMPSKVQGTFVYDWDLLIESTLRQNPDERPDSLVALLDQVALKELKEVEMSMKRFSPYSEKITPFAPPKEKEEVPQQVAVKSSMSAIEERLMGRDTSAYDRVSVIKKEEKSENVSYEKKPILNPSELKKCEYEEDPGAIFQTNTMVAPYRPKVNEVKEIEPLLTEMVVIEGGEYLRGSAVGARDEKPAHKVFIDTFALDIHPVTNEQFIRFLELMGGEKDSTNNDMIALKESRIKRVAGKFMIESGYAKHPVVGVSWYGARAYAKWVGKRLPTEAEWEVAATSGKEDHIYPSGESIERSQANFFSSDTTPVMSYKPNLSGLFDMAGNVYEWCEDWYGYNYYEQSQQEPNCPTGPHQGVYRVLRGGCWKSLKEDLRSSHRHRNNPGTMNRTCGFRCAANVG